MENCVIIKVDNICTEGRHPEDILSNLCGNDFCFDGVQCGCMESFLQSLKYQDEKLQKSICLEKARWVKEYDTTDWQNEQILWWRGKPIQRCSWQYQRLIYSAYTEMYLWCARFRDALMQTEGKELLFESGKNNPHEWVLTDKEFVRFLTKVKEHNMYAYKHFKYPRR